MSMDVLRKTVAELAGFVGGVASGDIDQHVDRVEAFETAGRGSITFVEDLRTVDASRPNGATCVIVPPGVRIDAPSLIEVARPKLAFARIAALLHPRARREPAIHETALVSATAGVDSSVFIAARAEIGSRTTIGARTEIHTGAVIGHDVKIGADCVIHPNVVLYDHVTLGDRVILHSGVVIGADGFGYVRGEDGYHKFPQIGTVQIEDDVEVGANTCVDRGALGRTRIGRGTKIDNLVQVAHNVDIGQRVVIAAQTGISGSTVIEDDAVIGGQVGFGDHARVQSGAVIGSKAGVLPGKIVRPGVWWGIPVQPLDEYKRLNAHLGRLPQMREELKELKKQVAELTHKLTELSQAEKGTEVTLDSQTPDS